MADSNAAGRIQTNEWPIMSSDDSIPFKGKENALADAGSQFKRTFADNERNFKGHSMPRTQTTPATLKVTNPIQRRGSRANAP